MKKYIAFIPAALLCANLCACGVEQAEPKAEEVPVMEEVQQQPEEPKATEEPKASEEDLAREQILADAEDRKQAVLNSETAIVKSDTFIKGETYTGTAYYVSNAGSDQNDGLSPETAFATIEPFDRINLAYGDAVFFERGSIWRAFILSPSLSGANGITFSAYGEGEKPKFYGSEENGSGADKGICTMKMQPERRSGSIPVI